MHRPVMMFKPALDVPQIRDLNVCSCEVYQAPVISMKVGEMVHSKAPCRVRRIIRCAKFFAKATQRTTTPHSTMTTERNFPV